ncbi:MAG: conjugal transfer protein TraG N-terminal domain-containing protein [Desulfobacterales bacterium]|nr:conjugal transfer protein TraG N-terminal domain-containing protein [Desulfobacterales bacterium]
MPKIRKALTLLFFSFALAALFVPARAYADIPNTLKTIKVYGELPYVVNALERLALVMSDANYQGLFFGIIVMMLVGGGLTLLAKSLTGGKISALIWAYLFGTLLCGIIVYHAFIRNTTTVLVTDETIGGKFKSVGGVPDGVAFLAGLINKIESGIVEMIWTAGNIEGFREEAGGIGFDIINKAFSNGVDLSMVDPNQATGKYVNMSLRRYIEDCFLFEVGRPGSTINVNDININTDFVPILASAASPAIFTVWYDAANPNGISLSCRQDWQNFLNPYLTGLTAASATVGTFWTHKCARADLAQRNYAAYGGLPIETVCKDKINSLVSSLLGVATTSDRLLRQYLIASELDRVIQEGAPDEVVKTVGSYRKGVDMIGAGIMLNEWLPIIKGGYYAIFLGLMPFLFLLIPTPLFPRALTFILGSFFFLGSWGICDAIVHSTAMDYAANTFREITEGQLGLKSMLLFENESYKAMAAFGASRLMALSMAGAMCAMLMKFGGSAFAHMIHRSSIAAGSHGRVAAELTSQGEPTRRAAYQRGISEAYPTQAWANDYSFHQRGAAGSYKIRSGTEAGLQTVDRVGGGSPGGAAVKTGGAAAMQAADSVFKHEQIQTIARATAVTEDDVQRAIQKFGVESRFSRATAIETLRDGLGLKTSLDTMQLMETARIGNFQGLKQAFDMAKSAGFRGDINDYVGMQAKVDSLESFQDKSQLETIATEAGYGNVSDFLKDRAEYQQSQNVHMIKELSEQAGARDVSIEDIGSLQARAQAMQKMGSYNYVKNAGLSAEYLRESGKLYNETSKMAIRKGLDEIGATGRMSTETQKLLRNIGQDPVGRAMLASQGIGDRIIKPEEAENFSKWFASQGKSVDANKLAGATAQMNVWTDKAGHLQSSLLTTKEGVVLSNANYASEVRSLTEDKVKSITGKAGPAGKYTILSTPEGAVVGIEGKGGYRASTGDVVLRETAGPEAFVVEKIDPNTGKAVRTHIEGGMDATTFIDKSRLMTGPEIASTDMLSAVIAKNPVLGDRISGAVTVASREMEEVRQAQAFSQSLSSIVSRTGNTTTFTNVDGRGTLKIGTPAEGLLGLGAKATGSVQIGRKNIEDHNYNLYYGMVRRMQSEAREKAARPDGTLDSEMYNKFYMQGLHNVWRATDELAHGKTEFSFGASGFVGEPWEDAKASMRKLRGKSSGPETQPPESHKVYREKIPAGHERP